MERLTSTFLLVKSKYIILCLFPPPPQNLHPSAKFPLLLSRFCYFLSLSLISRVQKSFFFPSHPFLTEYDGFTIFPCIAETWIKITHFTIFLPLFLCPWIYPNPLCSFPILVLSNNSCDQKIFMTLSQYSLIWCIACAMHMPISTTLGNNGFNRIFNSHGFDLINSIEFKIFALESINSNPIKFC